jgi:UDP-N-acetylbacillosamine N-acetyltransferase
MSQSIYIYGASGHGLVVADIAKACGYIDIIFIDDGINDYLSFDKINLDSKIPFVLGVGSNKIRKLLFNKVKKHNFKIETLVHPSSIISNNTIIGEGSIVMPNVVINSGSIIGKAVILNTSSVIEHENFIEDFVHISPSVSLAGNVKIGQLSHIGINSCIIQGLEVGHNSVIGAGSVVTKNIASNKLSYGNPCREIKDINE